MPVNDAVSEIIALEEIRVGGLGSAGWAEEEEGADRVLWVVDDMFGVVVVMERSV